VAWVAIQDQQHQTRSVVQQPAAEVDEHRPFKLPWSAANRSAPLAVTAESRLTPNRSPVVATTRGPADRRPGRAGVVVGAHPASSAT
jgi:hypothetical protein